MWTKNIFLKSSSLPPPIALRPPTPPAVHTPVKEDRKKGGGGKMDLVKEVVSIMQSKGLLWTLGRVLVSRSGSEGTEGRKGREGSWF